MNERRATCHCGAVVLELSLPDGIVNRRRCDCSICWRKGTIVASVALGYTVARLEGVNPFDLGPVPTYDGVNHPSDC